LRYALAVPCAARRARAGANSRIPALEHARLSPRARLALLGNAYARRRGGRGIIVASPHCALYEGL
jgi:hypothetical protein